LIVKLFDPFNNLKISHVCCCKKKERKKANARCDSYFGYWTTKNFNVAVMFLCCCCFVLSTSCCVANLLLLVFCVLLLELEKHGCCELLDCFARSTAATSEHYYWFWCLERDLQLDRPKRSIVTTGILPRNKQMMCLFYWCYKILLLQRRMIVRGVLLQAVAGLFLRGLSKTLLLRERLVFFLHSSYY